MTEPGNRTQAVPTGIDGFDHIAHGGLPAQRTTLVCGTTGSGKTIFAAEFLWRGITQFGMPGVFITFEETPDDIITNVASLGWDLESCVKNGTLTFVDASPRPDDTVEAGSYDLGALRARVTYAIASVGAGRVVVDSISALFPQYSDTAMIRRELHRLSSMLKELGCTVMMTAERLEEYGAISRFGVEEFVTDNVIILRNLLERGRRRRSAEVLKFRGALHEKGEYPFTISSGGLKFFPLSAIELTQKSSNVRISSGNTQIDDMCGGGFFRDSVILVSGATGTGKTLMVTKFLEAGAQAGERCLLFAFEESREQLLRNGTSWGTDLEHYEQQSLIKIVCQYPESRGLEDHLVLIEQMIREFKPNRVAIDSLTALERGVSEKAFREFVIALTAYLKRDQITGLFTNTTDV
ncbi:MAG: circadian clock protein KaiC, partial [Chloroflexaceae bacterium]|nr:circadian clock protein KaiC [Chloroflexaceae bacterium]